MSVARGDHYVTTFVTEDHAHRDARVRTDDQNLALQRAALKEAGCRRIYEETISGATRRRPQLARMLDQIRDQDVGVVMRLDRLARSTRDLLRIAEQLRDANAG
jgi:DNA invertase Pin-like site-specific DNA recombinase